MGQGNPPLAAALARPTVGVADVLATLEAIGAALPPADGVARFNALYLAMTRAVDGAIRDARFEDPAFMARFDAVFADQYFEALRRDLTVPDTVSRSWRALIDRRGAPGVHPLQFALAGMNAHINYDLARTLVITTRELGGTVATGSPRHRDFLAINHVLAETEATVKCQFLDGVIATLDHALGPLDDRAALWSIARARDAAWTHGEVLWMLRDTPLATAYETTLDRTVSLVGAALLV